MAFPLFGPPPPVETTFPFSEVRFSASATELQLDLLGEGPDGVVEARRCLLAPTFAGQFAAALAQGIANHEAKFQRIRVARGGPRLGAPTRAERLYVNQLRVITTAESFYLRLATLVPSPKVMRPVARWCAIGAPGLMPGVVSALEAELAAFRKATGW